VDLQDSSIRVLLVDDSQAFRRAATEFLRRHDALIVVGAICEGEEALAQAQELRAQLILIGLDRSGLEIISRLRGMLPDVGIIALTLLEGHASRQAAIGAGADELVRKADLTTELLPAIRQVIQAKGGAYDTS
jgi:DNA-binding NarL/FixJ family response regulator